MDEYFLHFLWKFQKFETKPLQLTEGTRLSVFNPGIENKNAGPDFLEGKIRIGNIDWLGNIEVHYRSSDWNHHGHQNDRKYDNVILHVVWIYDMDIILPDGSTLPTLQLSDFVSSTLENSYRKYINQPVTIKCASFLHTINPIVLVNMLDQALAERLIFKSEKVLEVLKSNKNDWEQTTFQLLARNFGFSVNNDPFEDWAKTIRYSQIKKYADNPTKCFAIAFGQAGFLVNSSEPQTSLLWKEYSYLKKLLHLKTHLERHHWKFSRLRPPNFPTVRMAELLTFIIGQENLFSCIIESKNAKSIVDRFNITLPHYWQAHYDFGKPLKRGENNLGKASIHIIIINTIVPILGAYSRYVGEQKYMDLAIELLQILPAENNKIIREWLKHDLKSKTAHDSQALLQRYKFYCEKSRCLNCNIGMTILQSGKK